MILMPAILHNDHNRNKVLKISLILQVHRVDRVLGFFSSRPDWNPFTPLTRRRVCPPLWFRGKGKHTRLREREWGSPNSDEGTDTLWYSRYNCTLCPGANIDHSFIQQAKDKKIMPRISMAVMYGRAWPYERKTLLGKSMFLTFLCFRWEQVPI
jgi:hypothetical protein